MRHMLYRLVIGVLGLALAGCGGDDNGPNGPGGPDPLVLAKAPAPNGDAQAGVVGAPLAEALRVTVTRSGEPEAGVLVAWTASGTGSIAGGTSDADGIATAIWTMPEQSGNATATASVAGANGSPISFTATADPGGAETLELAAGNNQTGDTDAALPTALQVRVEDQFGRRALRTKGDANEAADPWTFTLDGETQARVSFHVPYVGYLLSVLAIREARMVFIGLPALLIAFAVLAGVRRDVRKATTAGAASPEARS